MAYGKMKPKRKLKASDYALYKVVKGKKNTYKRKLKASDYMLYCRNPH